jgi:hypothetical protein
MTDPDRRRFLSRGLGGVAVLALGGSRSSPPPRGRVMPGGAPAGAPPALRIDVHSQVFNGHDVELARLLRLGVAAGDPGEADLIHAGADVAQALAWALAPSGAAETRRLDELARRREAGRLTTDAPGIRRDRDEADRRFREALRVVLPGTPFFRLYLDRLMPGVRAALGGRAAARLAGMAGAGVLDAAGVDFLLGPDGPERVALTIRPLEAFRRYTYYRYLGVCELFQARAGDDGSVDLVVPAVAAFEAWPGFRAAPTSPGDRVLAMARMVTLCGGRLHPLVPFAPGRLADGGDALALVRSAVEERGFIGVALSGRAAAGEGRDLHALLTWCAEEAVAVVVPGQDPGLEAVQGEDAGLAAWSSRLGAYPGLELGVSGSAAWGFVQASRTPARPMYGLDWLRRSIEGDATHVLRRSGGTIHRLGESGRQERAVSGESAAAFLGLRRGERTRQRLERFYDRHRVDPPPWMRKLDGPATA